MTKTPPLPLPQIIQLPYGKSQLVFSLPNFITADVILPSLEYSFESGKDIIGAALDNPLGGFSWQEAGKYKSAAIAINDKTRYSCYKDYLSSLLERLSLAGIPANKTSLIIGNGTHIPMIESEYLQILPPDVLRNYPVFSHDCDDSSQLVYLGQTSRETPVYANAKFMAADLKLSTGNIEPHHFAGFSGGVKSAAIGLTGRLTINANHTLLLDDRSTLNTYENNPLRQDIEEIGQFMKIDLAFNTVFNENKDIVAAMFGKPGEVMRVGIPVSRQVCLTRVTKKYDLIIASAGGFPKDINFYQSQKALTHATQMLNPGGCIILVASCSEGVGSQTYLDFMDGVDSQADVIQKTKQMGFIVGPHKALQVAKIAQKARIILVSDIADKIVGKLLIEPASDIQNAIRAATSKMSLPYNIAVLPRATNTIPFYE